MGDLCALGEHCESDVRETRLYEQPETGDNDLRYLHNHLVMSSNLFRHESNLPIHCTSSLVRTPAMLIESRKTTRHVVALRGNREAMADVANHQ